MCLLQSYKHAPDTSELASLSCPAQVGYLIGEFGQFGKPADLRRDAKALAAELQSVIGQYSGAQYRSLQQQGMGRDACWDLPTQEWEQVTTDLSKFTLYLHVPPVKSA